MLLCPPGVQIAGVFLIFYVSSHSRSREEHGGSYFWCFYSKAKVKTIIRSVLRLLAKVMAVLYFRKPHAQKEGCLGISGDGDRTFETYSIVSVCFLALFNYAFSCPPPGSQPNPNPAACELRPRSSRNPHRVSAWCSTLWLSSLSPGWSIIIFAWELGLPSSIDGFSSESISCSSTF